MGTSAHDQQRPFIVNGTERVTARNARSPACSSISKARPIPGNLRSPAGDPLSRSLGTTSSSTPSTSCSRASTPPQDSRDVADVRPRPSTRGDPVTIYKKIIYKRAKEGWRVPFDATASAATRTINDLIDADSGRSCSSRQEAHRARPRQLRRRASGAAQVRGTRRMYRAEDP